MKPLRFLPLFLALASILPAQREVLSLDTGWRFHLGDIPFPEVKGGSWSYANAKAGSAGGAAWPGYDDSEWRVLDLPHDWVVEGPYDKNANVAQGYRPRGFAWYRRHFKLSPLDRGRHLELQFDGIATHATVWFNGSIVQRNFCGYTSFQADITPFARYGDQLNTIAVRVDAEQQEGWWYEGGGIYRHTWLVKRAAAHIITDGVYANPQRDPKGSWSIPVEVSLQNSGKDPANLKVECVVLDAAGKVMASGGGEASLSPLGETQSKFSISVASPHLWSLEDPYLYTVRTRLSQAGSVLDEQSQHCGFRSIRFDADKGFFLNDKPVKLKGTCNHQDASGVGVAVPDSLFEYRLRKLKEMGSNAYRSAHNPPAKEFLEACDRLGMLVMDENRLFNPAPEYRRQLEWMVRRDRNHPSVILWSVFNEEPMQDSEQGYEMVRRMAASVKSLDSTRPVTAAMNNGWFSPVNVAQAVDVVGFNYSIWGYDKFHEQFPKVPMTSSEDTSGLMTRDEFETDKSRNTVASYDEDKPSWGNTHRESWKAIAERPFIAGGFVWTGFDYRGEPTPYEWPSASSSFGCMDLCGFPKTAFYLHQAQWASNKEVLHLEPHWNWPGKEGQPIKVMALSNAEEVELFLNGKSLGAKKVDPYEMTDWQVPYAPGKLSAIGRRNGKEVSNFAVETAGVATALRLLPDRDSLAGDGMDAMPVSVVAVDAKGRRVPGADAMVEFELEGPGRILGVDNGDPNSHEAEKASKRSLFHGLAQVIIQSKMAGERPLILRAKAPGLKSASLNLPLRAASSAPGVPAADPFLSLGWWRRAPMSDKRPDPGMAPADNDQNSWLGTNVGELQDFKENEWTLYRTTVRPYAMQRHQGAKLRFKSIVGKAEIWVDGKLAARKTNPGAGELLADLVPSEAAERIIAVLLQADKAGKAGLADSVLVEKLPAN